MPHIAITFVQLLAILLVSLVAGAVFGIWRGYDPLPYAPATFLEVHQGAVRGLNVLLPATAMASLLLTLVLAAFARRSPALWLYLVAAVFIVVGGLITRLGNQPINVEIMRWTPETMPVNWPELRDAWWRWHVLRLTATIAALLFLILAVFADRDARASAGATAGAQGRIERQG